MSELGENDIRVDFAPNGDAHITILEGDDAGIVFKYGRVAIDESSGEPEMSFGYEIITGTPVNKDTFVDSIAHLLHKMILFQLEQGTVQYVNGVDTPGVVTLDEAPEVKDENMFPKPGVFTAKKGESAMSFLDQLAASGMAAMKK